MRDALITRALLLARVYVCGHALIALRSDACAGRDGVRACVAAAADAADPAATARLLAALLRVDGVVAGSLVPMLLSQLDAPSATARRQAVAALGCGARVRGFGVGWVSVWCDRVRARGHGFGVVWVCI